MDSLLLSMNTCESPAEPPMDMEDPRRMNDLTDIELEPTNRSASDSTPPSLVKERTEIAEPIVPKSSTLKFFPTSTFSKVLQELPSLT
jgi:hypothetical protein